MQPDPVGIGLAEENIMHNTTDVLPARSPGPAPTASSRRRARTAAVWALQALLAISFAGAGTQKLAGTQSMVELFERVGVGQWLRYVVGGLELAGAIGLLIPLLSGLAALGVTALMAGASVTNLLVGLPPWIPLAFLVVAAVIARVRWSRTLVLPGELRRSPRRAVGTADCT
jgi:uncharacterized membrane protein